MIAATNMAISPSPPGKEMDKGALLRALRAVQRGDSRVRLDPARAGIDGEIADAFNAMVDQLNEFASEVTRVAREVGTEGKLGGQAQVTGVAGIWKDLTDNVNSMARNLTSQVRNIAEVTTAVARGDLSKKITVDVEGEILELKNTINTMVDQLSALAGEVTRVAGEVGTDGKLGGQANVTGVAGTWKDLTDNVNSMARNLTSQVRNIAEVTTAVARGDLSKQITVDVRGEILELKNTVNTMVDQLNAFASEVTRVAREVGTEGKLGGQAEVPGVAGTWKDLTDNVNSMAGNLTAQVRSIASVATAVTRGDLSRTIELEASGEVELLKNDVNEMIRNLRDTTLKNQEQYWLKTNLARFGGILQGERDLGRIGSLVLSELSSLLGVQHAVFYVTEAEREPTLRRLASYAGHLATEPPKRFRMGEGLVGQCALDHKVLVLDDLPDDYLPIRSGLGEHRPQSVVIQPVVFDDETLGVIELASFRRLSQIQMDFLGQLAETIGITLNTLTADIRQAELQLEQAARAEAEAGLARLRQVVDVMPEGILIADGSGRVYLSNAAARAIMGEVPTAVIPENGEAGAVHWIDGSVCPPEEAPLARAVYDRDTVLGEQLVVTNPVTGKEVTILVNSAPLSDAVGGASGGVAVFQDISPLRDLERQKDEFLAAVSHDLKTPATIIMGRANLLSRALNRRDGATADELTDGLQAIDESTVQLVRLVDELLDVTRMRMGQPVTLDLEAADLVKIVRRLGQEYRNLHPSYPIEVESDGSSLVGDWDEARIERVVANLLTNAIKYSPNGRPIVVRTAEERDGDRVWAVLTVEDQGIGIRPEELDRIFDPYFRGSNVPRSVSGTGVGLAGARHIVEQHEGTIAVQSTLGEGTTFTVRLPLIAEPIDDFDVGPSSEPHRNGDQPEAVEALGSDPQPEPVASVAT